MDKDNQAGPHNPTERVRPRICTISNPCCLELRFAVIIIAVLEILVGLLCIGFYSLFIFTDEFLDKVGYHAQMPYKNMDGTITDTKNFQDYEIQLTGFRVVCSIGLGIAIIQTVTGLISIFVVNYVWFFIWAGFFILRIIVEIISFFFSSVFDLIIIPRTILQLWFIWVILAYGSHLRKLQKLTVSTSTTIRASAIAINHHVKNEVQVQRTQTQPNFKDNEMEMDELINSICIDLDNSSSSYRNRYNNHNPPPPYYL